jgi:hypothetical protein
MHQSYQEIRRQEHYREWLATQNVLESMRQADIRDNGRSNIPVHNKQPAYGGYPQSESSGQQDRNATPGPSHPRRADQDIRHRRISDRESSRSCMHDKCSRPSSRDKIGPQGKDPSDPDDSESSDSTYKDHTRYHD